MQKVICIKAKTGKEMKAEVDDLVGSQILDDDGLETDYAVDCVVSLSVVNFDNGLQAFIVVEAYQRDSFW